VSLCNIATVLGWPARGELLFAKSIPVLAGITANKAPKALNDYAFGNGSGSLEVRCNPPRLICENDVPMPDVRRARLVPIGWGSADRLALGT
jgi:hypothetical protein